jgi:DNA-binding winged helix-turn-helix (wHTH) protein/TolB-like protein
MNDARWAIGDSGEFEFDVATGELSRRDGQAPPQRLGPQPAALLSLLIARQGGVVAREEIRAALWPDVSVEFDASLHHCVRQVRSAFGERASEARYIGTIPKRGYRLEVAAVEILAEPPVTAAPAIEASVAPLLRSRRRALPILAGLGLVSLAAFGFWISRPAPLRVAIMPFADPQMTPTIAAMADQLGERVLADLTERLGARADVVGPRTTGPLREHGLSLADIAAKLDLAFVINARFTGTTEAPALLIELIRSSDGKHVWVKLYEQPPRWTTAGPEIVAGIADALPA